MGERFGQYEIVGKLAKGGMAEVLLAKQQSIGGFERLVCIKRILPHLSEHKDFIAMFLDEARIAATLNHPNIAQIYEISQVEDTYYIAMEYVRGEDLRRVYNQEVGRGQVLPLDMAAHVIMCAAEALDYAHRQTTISGSPLGIVHRDVSPQNIIVTYDGHVKLVDFGVAKAAGKMAQTRSGVLKGKYSYMSPEQASGNAIDGRTDIFALGICLYEVTTGRRLFKREQELDTLHAVIEAAVKPPHELVRNYHDDLEEMVLKALARDPEERYQTAGELGQEIERYLIKHNHAPGPQTLAAYMQDLFADKLADELLFGGQNWSAEPDTPAQVAGVAPAPADLPAAAEAVRPDDRRPAGSVDAGTLDAGAGASALAAQGGAHDEVSTRVGRDLDDDRTIEDIAAPARWVSDRGRRAQAHHDWEPSGQSNVATVPQQVAPTYQPSERAAAAAAAQPQPEPVRPSPPTGDKAMPPRRGQSPLARLRSAVNVQRPRTPFLVAAAAGMLALAIYLAFAAEHGRLRPPPQQQQREKPREAQVFEMSPRLDAAQDPTMRPVPSAGRLGFVTVEAPVPMTVTIAGRELGTSPMRRHPLPPGSYRLRLHSPDEGLTIRQQVEITDGHTDVVRVEPRKGFLVLNAKPWAWVERGTYQRVQTPIRLDLQEGEYAVTFECENGHRQTRRPTVTAGRMETLTVDCREPKGP